jgi:hypothetical protein
MRPAKRRARRSGVLSEQLAAMGRPVPGDAGNAAPDLGAAGDEGGARVALRQRQRRVDRGRVVPVAVDTCQPAMRNRAA